MLPSSDRRRALVAGGGGFLGSHLCEALLDLDVEVVAIDNFVTGRVRNLDQIADHPNFRLVDLDACCADSISGSFDFVFHLASAASPPEYLKLPIETLHAGSVVTQTLLQIAKRDQARFVFASTSEIYGDPLEHPQRETYWGNVNPIGVRSVYDEAKRFGEALTMAYHRKYGTNTGIIRIFNTYGSRMSPNDGRAVPNFIRQALSGEPITIHGDGSQTRSLTYVDDLIAGMIAVAVSEIHEPVNLGNPNELTVLEIAELIRELANSDSPIVHEARPLDDPNRRQPEISKAQELLGWEPKISAREGLAKTIDYFRKYETKISEVVHA